MTLDEQARDVLRKNDKGGYTLPTHGLYPYQWNWDSAFAAWGFTTFDPDRGWTELETLMSGQWEDGMLPHILFHRVDPVTSPVQTFGKGVAQFRHLASANHLLRRPLWLRCWPWTPAANLALARFGLSSMLGTAGSWIGA
jgi:hypothetical protein